jgi:hypothetical protein
MAEWLQTIFFGMPQQGAVMQLPNTLQGFEA